MRLTFRQRVFLGLVGLGTLPLAAALLVLALQAGSTASPAGQRAAMDELAESGRALIAAVDTTVLSPEARTAVSSHTEAIARQTTLARQADLLSRSAAVLLAVVIVVAAVVLVVLSLTTARRLSNYASAPIEELVRWVRLIEQQASLPERAEHRGAPEFAALRQALHGLADALDRARHQELEQERLKAFRETARRVAHEMRGPLTAARLALRQLATADDAHGTKATSARAVLEDETKRLEAMATEFSEFGRLPEGPEAPVDLGELLDGVVRSLPEECAVERDLPDGLVVRGHFEALRRAFHNLVRNAAEATDDRGIAVAAERREADGSDVARVTVTDHGPGVPAADRQRIFEPYVTSKDLGTGLGLAIAHQAVHTHGGTIVVTDADGGGSAFVVTLPLGDS